VTGSLAASGCPGNDDRIVTVRCRSLPGIALVLFWVGSVAACTKPEAVSTAPTAASKSPAAASVDAGSPPVSAGISSPAASAAAATSASPTAAPSPVLRLTSGAFANGAAIPRRFTCDGANVSPPLAWDGVPSDAAALVLIVDDPDARSFVHWVAFDIAAAPSGQLADGASRGAAAQREGTNSFGKVGWSGPCPPSGTHHYRFRLFAIRQALGLRGAPTAAEVLAAMKGQVVAETTLIGLYHR
jgi:Raf kinase inhibitor-like YbhB/YbcL family protein